MKWIHLSDLHLGKTVNGFSMIQNQRAVLEQILLVTETVSPDCVMIAGDVYDKSVPTVEAVTLFDGFLAALSARCSRIFLISGNHDSAERLSFGSAILKNSGIVIARAYGGEVEFCDVPDAYGAVRVFLLPFLKPSHVRPFFPDTPIDSYTDAVRAALSTVALPTDGRSVLIAHQFVAGGGRCESEELSVGGTDAVDADVFAPFSHVALGHLHGPQTMEGGRLRYCGSPLKYSFSECRHEKSVTVGELDGENRVTLTTVPLIPPRDLCEVRGSYLEVTEPSFVRAEHRNECYVHITLTDEDDVPDAVAKLRLFYPYLMRLDYDNRRTRTSGDIVLPTEEREMSPTDFFSALFELQNNAPMRPEQSAAVDALVRRIWGEE